MICISIAQESRRLALADLLNASRQGDLIEVRLDHFEKSPDIAELLSVKPKPLILTCRRRKDGGQWDRGEDERLALLRQGITGKADYVEIELDVADQIRPFPGAKRVISYTNLQETPSDIGEIYAEAQTKHPDVIKLTTLARTPEEAWPLVQILAKPALPTVVVGLGEPGIMLSMLGRKIGAPWTYAALERGMEAHPNQPTVSDLKEIYHYDEINRSTKLIGVTGFGQLPRATCAGLNAAFAHLGLSARCLPLGIGSVRLFRRVVDAVKLAGVIVDQEHRQSILEMVTELDPTAQQAQAADLLLHKGEKWHGYSTELGALVAAMENAVRVKFPGDNPLQGRMVLIVGTNPLAQTMAREAQARGAGMIIASHGRKAALELAQQMGCRHVQFEAIYSTMHDVLIVCDTEKDQMKTKKSEAGGIHPGYLRPGMTVLDLTELERKTPLTREAELRGCSTVTPRRLFLDQLGIQVQLLTGKQVGQEVLQPALAALPEEEEPS
jgi:3-dehydroquinate dehydratase/shikimate dehydrogenase